MENLKFLDLLSENDYYIENGNVIYTAYFLAKRGYCCGSICRHCPYKKTKQEKKMSLEERISVLLSEKKNPQAILNRITKTVRTSVDSALSDLITDPGIKENVEVEDNIKKAFVKFSESLRKEFKKIQ